MDAEPLTGRRECRRPDPAPLPLVYTAIYECGNNRTGAHAISRRLACPICKLWAQEGRRSESGQLHSNGQVTSLIA